MTLGSPFARSISSFFSYQSVLRCTLRRLRTVWFLLDWIADECEISENLHKYNNTIFPLWRKKCIVWNFVVLYSFSVSRPIKSRINLYHRIKTSENRKSSGGGPIIDMQHFVLGQSSSLFITFNTKLTELYRNHEGSKQIWRATSQSNLTSYHRNSRNRGSSNAVI